jgi:hypothetical protein
MRYGQTKRAKNRAYRWKTAKGYDIEAWVQQLLKTSKIHSQPDIYGEEDDDSNQ